ncbi:MAG TPA: carboxyltransferase domain-containing protein [Flexivirga sp.]|uniref:5-oxoprolinase subunit B family protein n=1 Tax=Flexivirga sp. TaxID=1962927 RepID=UPI002C117DBF|nr:carboxyltransferase domain-containing protein [Flexivirga sp.]HWC21576.1 carboxyltransferase domain-containing protein [Flexivirga sp.]
MTDTLTLRPYGARAVLVELPDAMSRRALTRWLDSTDHAGVSVIPAELTVLLDVSDLTIDESDAQQRLRRVTRELADLDLSALPAAEASDTRLHTIDVRYDGPDLDTVAQQLAMSTDTLIRWHTDAPWTVEFLGFMPGFGYLTRDDHVQEVARRHSPRSAIPAGSVGFAGRYSAIYPGSSPGGWQLVGHTEQRMFDLDAGGAALAPNDRVQFRPVR